MLAIVPSCNLVPSQGKLIMQPWENGKKHNFGHNLGPQKNFSRVLHLLLVRQCSELSFHLIQFSGKLMNQTWKNAKNLILGPTHLAQTWAAKFFLLFLLLLVVRHYSKLSSYVVYRKTNHPNLRKWPKPNSRTNFGLFGPNLGPQTFFLLVLPLLVVRHCSQLSSMQFKGKLQN